MTNLLAVVFTIIYLPVALFLSIMIPVVLGYVLLTFVSRIIEFLMFGD
jgi:hypothetical protein